MGQALFAFLKTLAWLQTLVSENKANQSIFQLRLEQDILGYSVDRMQKLRACCDASYPNTGTSLSYCFGLNVNCTFLRGTKLFSMFYKCGP